jgi:hypothetical protein
LGLNQLWIEGRMSTKPQPSMDAERTKELAVELSGLLRQQLEALQEAAFIRMNEEEVEAYERRSKRIAELKRMLDGASRL